LSIFEVSNARLDLENKVRKRAEHVHPFLESQRLKPPGFRFQRLFGPIVGYASHHAVDCTMPAISLMPLHFLLILALLWSRQAQAPRGRSSTASEGDKS